MSRKLPEFRTPYLNDYMAMVEDTESPRIMHLWSAISALSACLGRRCWLPFGSVGNILPNQFIVLVGSPASRKSASIGITKRLLREATQIRFAPSDTAGQRQGLAGFMQGDVDEDGEKDVPDVNPAMPGSLRAMTLGNLMDMGLGAIPQEGVVKEDRHHVMVCASEFTQFIGHKNVQMLEFLLGMWDGEPYTYKTRNSGSVTMENPLLNILAATTPVSLNAAMPPEAGGQGFTSRMILVYGAEKYKSVPRPSVPPAELVGRVKEVMSDIYYNRHGMFSETPQALQKYEDLYNNKPPVEDSRFISYSERRHTHLMKLAMALAAVRQDMMIVEEDYEEANLILTATEHGMAEALGQYGLSKLAVVKQNLLDFMRVLGHPVTWETIVASQHRDATNKEVQEALGDLVAAGLIRGLSTAAGQAWTAVFKTKKATDDSIMDALSQV